MYFEIEEHPHLHTWSLTIGNDCFTLDALDMEYLSKLLREEGF